MNNNEIVNRDEILGNNAHSYNFDKVLRGYDTKQVDDFINNLVKSNKSASELFDNRLKDLGNSKEMLKTELEHTKEKLAESQNSYDKLKEILESVKKERDNYKHKAENDKKTMIQDNTTQVAELEERLEKALVKNRLLQEENKKLNEQTRDLQRDVAHLSKKVDKNRNKINDLTGQVESGMATDDSKKYSEVAKIYENAIDKAEDLIYRLQTEFSLAHSKAEDVTGTNE
jgi:cell division initiation protein